MASIGDILTDEDVQHLGRRVDALPWVRWLPGVMALSDDGEWLRVAEVEGCAIRGIASYGPDSWVTGGSIHKGRPWFDVSDAPTVGALIGQWQRRPGHVFMAPCPVMTMAAAFGLTHPTTVRALVDAMESAR